MVPGIVVGVAGNARRNPVLVLVVPNVPLVAACDAALVAKDETHTVEEQIDVKLQGLRKAQITPVKVHVISEVVECGNQRLIAVRYALRRSSADQRIVPQGVRVGRTASEPEHSGLATHRRRADALSHGEGDPVAGRRRTVHKVWRSL